MESYLNLTTQAWEPAETSKLEIVLNEQRRHCPCELGETHTQTSDS